MGASPGDPGARLSRPRGPRRQRGRAGARTRSASAAYLCCCGAAGPLDGTAVEEARSTLVPLEGLPLRTHRRFVVDADGRHVQLACVNWYGAHQRQMVMNGLDRQPLKVIASAIGRLGFNCVRLPFSLDLVFGNLTAVPDAERTLRANPALLRKTPLEVFDASLAALTDAGLLVILNQHVSSSGWCCSNTDGEGFWYTDRYPEVDWLEALSLMSARYRDNPRVVGFDLRNEIRPSWQGIFQELWRPGISVPSWGAGARETDWAAAAVRGSRRVLTKNPNMLIVVSGIQFGMRLVDVRRWPIHVSAPELRNQTIYSTHLYYGWIFDFVAYDLLLDLTRPLLLAAAGLWALLAADAWQGQRGTRLAPHVRAYDILPPGPLEEGPSGGSPTAARRRRWAAGVVRLRAAAAEETRGRWELVCVGVLLVLILALLSYGKHLELVCGHVHIVSPPAFAVLAYYCIKASLLLWARVLAAYLAVLTVWSDRREGLARHPSLDSHAESLTDGLADEKAASASDSDEAAGRPRVDAGRDPHSDSEGSNNPRGRAVGCGHRCGRRCGRQASLRLLEPLRARPKAAAVGAFLALAALALEERHLGSYDAFERNLEACWGFLLRGTEVEPAPVWLSEFGTAELDRYWTFLTRYMRENEIDFAYWSINGEHAYREREGYGLLRMDSATVRNPRQLKTIQQMILLPAYEAQQPTTDQQAF